MLDVVTVVSDTTNKNYIQECRMSIRRAKQMCSFDVNVIESPGIIGNIGQAMQRGMQQGTAPYVVWVDDDDFVLPNAFSCLEKHFEKKPSAIFAREVMLLANGRHRPRLNRHHLTAFRRDVVESMPMEEYATHTSMDMRLYIEQNHQDYVDELSWVYVHRKYDSEGFKLRQAANVDPVKYKSLMRFSDQYNDNRGQTP